MLETHTCLPKPDAAVSGIPCGFGAVCRLLAVWVVLGMGGCADDGAALPEPSTEEDGGMATLDVPSEDTSTPTPCEGVPMCGSLGELACEGNTVRVCQEDAQGCLVWMEQEACGDEAFCAEGQCRSCGWSAGSWPRQTLEVDGTLRTYFIHVPQGARCSTALPVLVDFHGTATTTPEELYLLARLVALADQEGFLVVRPRSLSSNGPSGTIYRWDENPGDLERNVAYTKTLLAHLAQQLHLDSERMYASGFSSGSNMVAQFLADPEDTFAGLGLMAGGIWADPGIGDLGGRQERFYAVTGFRDYLHFTWVRLSTLLDAQGMDPALRWERQVDAGHELHGWHFEEMWHWLDRGQRPQPEPQAPE